MTRPSGDARTAAITQRDLRGAQGEADGYTRRSERQGNAPCSRDSATVDGRPQAAKGRNDKGRARKGAKPERSDEAIYGALDLGTNNCRLLVARPSRRGFFVIDAFSRIIRLGEGLLGTGRLSDQAIDRTIEALKVCAEKMSRRGVSRSRLIATEACRIADNREEFLDRIRRETGLNIEIVSQETEAKLAVSGCSSLIDPNSDWALIFDIGGGSSELIWLDLAQFKRRWRGSLTDRLDVQDCIAAWTSLPIGVVNLAERHGGRDLTGEGYEAMVQEVTAAVEAFEAKHKFRDRITNGGAHFLGTSGTVTTIAGVHLKLPFYERSRVDGCWLSADEARAVSMDLSTMSYADRVAQPCIGQERADLVLAGCAILEALFRMWPCERVRVADRGLREGILATLMAEDGHEGKLRRRRRRRRRGNGSSPKSSAG
ncbi:Ppx/GppA phosphatase family protein [Methyloligella solikamskensis]|uniref:Ppx/GppA phosphatase family protein n=1 Tax=Methyloligella solikamskensis TaxID=1177756 RepID=A0ABW3J8S2_9HYPH